ncbi:MAG: tetratricopeptide repeat protein [Rhodospirillales bacterium]|nr:tetratricopeptide repeat protein [Rhodospirillales bacterium]
MTSGSGAPAHIERGDVCWNAGDFESALGHYRLALDADAGNVEACSNVAAAHYQLDEFKESAKFYRRCLKLDADYVEALFGLASALRGLEDYAAAAVYYRQALALEPDRIEPHWELGFTLDALGDVIGASEAYRACLNLDPAHGVATHLLNALTGTTTLAAPADYIASLFDDYAEGFEQSLLDDLHYSVPEHFRAEMTNIFGAPNDMRANNDSLPISWALDLGAGTGLIAKAIKPWVENIHGVDLSKNMLARAAEDKIFEQIFVMDMADFLSNHRDGAQKTYDLAVSGDAFVYIGDLEPVFRGVANRLADQGWFLFTVECLDIGDYALLPTGRYAHSKTYIQDTAEIYGLKVMDLRKIIPRRDGNEAISGYFCALQFK